MAPSAGAGELNIAEVRLGSIADTIGAAGVVVPVHEAQVPSPIQLDLQSTRAKLQRSQTLRQHGGVSAEDLLTAELNVKRNEIQLRQQQEQIEDVRRATASNVEGAQLQQSILRKQTP